jgi:hypothetical protein
VSTSGRPDLVVTSFGPFSPPARQVYELRLGERMFSREVTERERVAEEVGGFWQEAGRLERDAQVLRARADETAPGLGKVRRGDVEPQLEEEAWEMERSLFVALFPEAEPFLATASRVERDKAAQRDQEARDRAGRRRVEAGGVTSVFDLGPRVTREMVEGDLLRVAGTNPGMACALCGSMIPITDLVDLVERHREWHDVLVRTREIPVRH